MRALPQPNRTLTVPACLRLLCAAGALSLAACAGPLPYYEATPNDASISFVGMGSPTFCSADGRYNMTVTEADGYRTAKVPAGKPITLRSYMSFSGYQVISSCFPMLSFTPVSGKHYVLNAGLANNQCFIELVREDKAAPTGVTVEKSVGDPTC